MYCTGMDRVWAHNNSLAFRKDWVVIAVSPPSWKDLRLIIFLGMAAGNCGICAWATNHDHHGISATGCYVVARYKHLCFAVSPTSGWHCVPVVYSTWSYVLLAHKVLVTAFAAQKSSLTTSFSLKRDLKLRHFWLLFVQKPLIYPTDSNYQLYKTTP